ncbi:hypothetical protein T265_00947 [Opisthorchis viverrini]|uniref:HECT-type E3 ubiquitin transferase n=1 Tax=Opisthorchis viverrini TaxID=6198 RepID=A0A075AJA4_OPIVI|nr:hypothetical protein T265_00947 [Opisthorchis viverrini]KER33039.1 hypothetical protein T265_00947 [Opisthorchis viverrini]
MHLPVNAVALVTALSSNMHCGTKRTNIKHAALMLNSKGLFNKNGDLYIEILVDNVVAYKTKTCLKNWNPTWNETASVVVSPNSKIRIRVFNHFKYRPDILIAAGGIDLFRLLEEYNGVRPLTLVVSDCELKLPLSRGSEHRGSVLLIFDKLNIRNGDPLHSRLRANGDPPAITNGPTTSFNLPTNSTQRQSSSSANLPDSGALTANGISNSAASSADMARSTSSVSTMTSSNGRAPLRTSNRSSLRLTPMDVIEDSFWPSLIGSLFGLQPISSSSLAARPLPSSSSSSADSSRDNRLTLPDRQRPRADWTEAGEWWILDTGSSSPTALPTSASTSPSSAKHSKLTSYFKQQTFSDSRPLPMGWERRIDPASQRIYYVNHISKITQWEDPRERGMDETQPLPRGWEKRYTPQGQRFFIDHNTRTTTFIDPRTGQHAGSLGSLGVPLQYERNFRAKLDYFRACCAHAMIGGQTKILVSRDNLLEDSFQLVSQMTATNLRRRLSITFLHEEGLDYGGVAREWFYRLSREIFNPMFGLFEYTGKNYGLQINPGSHVNPNHLSYFRFVGRFIGMALFHGRCIDGGLTLTFYKRILGRKLTLEDLGLTDHEYYQSLVFIRDNNIDKCDLELYFVASYDLLGALHEDELIEGGKNIKVTEANKMEYISLMVDWRFSRGISKQTEAVHKGIHEVLEPQWLQLFDERELELLLSGMPEIDVADWEKNTVYLKYTRSSKQIVWFWKSVCTNSSTQFKVNFQTKNPIGLVIFNSYNLKQIKQAATAFSLDSPTPKSTYNIGGEKVSLCLSWFGGKFCVSPVTVGHAAADGPYLKEAMEEELRNSQDEDAEAFKHLPCDVATEVEDLLEDIPQENPYDALRAAVVSRKGKSEDKMLRDLFTTVELGDRSPSQMLRHMRSLLCGLKLAVEIMAQLLLDNLPPSMSHVINAFVDDHRLEQLAQMADKIHETYPSCPANSVSRPAPTTDSDPLLASISHLQAKFDALTDRLQRLEINRHRPRSRSRLLSRARPSWCWYHQSYGPKARKCQRPCSFKPPSSP